MDTLIAFVIAMSTPASALPVQHVQTTRKVWCQPVVSVNMNKPEVFTELGVRCVVRF